jgi:hypothetical protein
MVLKIFSLHTLYSLTIFRGPQRAFVYVGWYYLSILAIYKIKIEI